MLVALAHDRAGVVDWFVTELGVVHQAINAIGDADEGSDRDQLGTKAGGDKAGPIGGGQKRVLLESFQ
ncbi:hypothetical protein [Streptomyces sp. NPDC005953]|uniref:hypothetical protein n=1 Tax=Streptomyces sp. NPDC005953 TaxID=3156719 RepID=UPI00340C5E6A